MKITAKLVEKTQQDIVAAEQRCNEIANLLSIQAKGLANASKEEKVYRVNNITKLLNELKPALHILEQKITIQEQNLDSLSQQRFTRKATVTKADLHACSAKTDNLTQIFNSFNELVKLSTNSIRFPKNTEQLLTSHYAKKLLVIAGQYPFADPQIVKEMTKLEQDLSSSDEGCFQLDSNTKGDFLYQLGRLKQSSIQPQELEKIKNELQPYVVKQPDAIHLASYSLFHSKSASEQLMPVIQQNSIGFSR